MLCSEATLVKQERHQITLSPLKCKCWHCELCRPARAARLVEEAKRGLPNLFITLTSKNPGYGSPHKAARELVAAWRVVREAYIAKHGKGSLPFLAVFERTKKGWPHVHIVARCKWLDQKWLSDMMRDLIGSPVVDVRRVSGVSKVAHYITKYISKNPERFKGVKRYWRSLDYLKPTAATEADPKDPTIKWERLDGDWRYVAECHAKQGFTVEYARDRATIQLRGPP